MVLLKADAYYKNLTEMFKVNYDIDAEWVVKKFPTHPYIFNIRLAN